MVDQPEGRMPECRDDPELPPPPFPGSHLVLDDDYVFVSGLVAADVVDSGDPSIGDVAAETRLVLSELRRMLETVGCGMDRVVRADVHLADLREIETMDGIYRQFFAEGRYPARTCTESPRLFGGCRVEITPARPASLKEKSRGQSHCCPTNAASKRCKSLFVDAIQVVAPAPNM